MPPKRIPRHSTPSTPTPSPSSPSSTTPAPMTIPGYYYDPDKQRYFKIQHDRMVQATHAYRKTTIEKRKMEWKEEGMRDEGGKPLEQRFDIFKSRPTGLDVLRVRETGCGISGMMFGSFIRESRISRITDLGVLVTRGWMISRRLLLRGMWCALPDWVTEDGQVPYKSTSPNPL
ncbi:hypothetical protein BC829DRAFT_432850 [Chytridium lagenaria]|nr:hypothetical protein BC829DRAFT_432850 [Chytridium lagenaria]